MEAYKDKKDVKTVQSEGLHIAGERFVVLKADDRSLYGKKVRGRLTSSSSFMWYWERTAGHGARTAQRVSAAMTAVLIYEPFVDWKEALTSVLLLPCFYLPRKAQSLPVSVALPHPGYELTAISCRAKKAS